MRAVIFALALFGAWGCDDPEPMMDASVPDTDAGTPPEPRIIIEQANLVPAVQRAESGGHVLRGRVKSTSVLAENEGGPVQGTATNGTHEIRGGFMPLAR